MPKKQPAPAKKSADQIRRDITEKIIAAIAAGTVPWRQPWVLHCTYGFPCNFLSKRRYSGINPLVLQLTAQINGWHSNRWGTTTSWATGLGVEPKTGEGPTNVTLFLHIPKKGAGGKPVLNEKGQPRTIPLMREFMVYNAEQMQAPSVAALLAVPAGVVATLVGGKVAGGRTMPTTRGELLAIAKKRLSAAAFAELGPTREEIAAEIHTAITRALNGHLVADIVNNTDPDFGPAEQFIAATGAKIKHAGGRAFYRDKPVDTITVPPKVEFESMADYYQTICHELVHWSEAKGRVKKRLPGDAAAKSKASYAFGELVAEIGSCFILSALGVPQSDKMLPNSQSYLAHWLKAMGGDSKYIFDAAAQASRCCDFLLAFVGQQNRTSSPPRKDDKPAKSANHRRAA
jgi:antirestriction protein ArdC